jgi:hypothetical protein
LLSFIHAPNLRKAFMPIIEFGKTNPLEDGRQSQRALSVRRGVQRLLIDFGHTMLPEVTLHSGRRADLMVLTPKGEFWIVEIKSSIEDLKVDRKWPEYRAYCDRLFFATLPDVPMEIFPEDCGFIVSDGYGAEMLREAPAHPLAAASRKALLLRFARSGAQRLLAAERAGLDVASLADE